MSGLCVCVSDCINFHHCLLMRTALVLMWFIDVQGSCRLPRPAGQYCSYSDDNPYGKEMCCPICANGTFLIGCSYNTPGSCYNSQSTVISSGPDILRHCFVLSIGFLFLVMILYNAVIEMCLKHIAKNIAAVTPGDSSSAIEVSYIYNPCFVVRELGKIQIMLYMREAKYLHHDLILPELISFLSERKDFNLKLGLGHLRFLDGHHIWNEDDQCEFRFKYLFLEGSLNISATEAILVQIWIPHGYPYYHPYCRAISSAQKLICDEPLGCGFLHCWSEGSPFFHWFCYNLLNQIHGAENQIEGECLAEYHGHCQIHELSSDVFIQSAGPSPVASASEKEEVIDSLSEPLSFLNRKMRSRRGLNRKYRRLPSADHVSTTNSCGSADEPSDDSNKSGHLISGGNFPDSAASIAGNLAFRTQNNLVQLNRQTNRLEPCSSQRGFQSFSSIDMGRELIAVTRHKLASLVEQEAIRYDASEFANIRDGLQQKLIRRFGALMSENSWILEQFCMATVVSGANENQNLVMSMVRRTADMLWEAVTDSGNNSIHYPTFAGIVVEVNGRGQCLMDCELYFTKSVLMAEDLRKTTLLYVAENQSSPLGLSTCREFFEEEHRTTLGNQEDMALFEQAYICGKKESGPMELQLMCERNNLIVIIVAPIADTAFNTVAAIFVPYSANNQEATPQIKMVKGGVLSEDQACHPMILSPFGYLMNPYLPEKLRHFNPIDEDLCKGDPFNIVYVPTKPRWKKDSHTLIQDKDKISLLVHWNLSKICSGASNSVGADQNIVEYFLSAAAAHGQRSLKSETVQELIEAAGHDDSFLQVIGFCEFPYKKFQKDSDPDSWEVEREYWFRVSEKKFQKESHDDDLVIVHVHYKDLWYSDGTAVGSYDRSVISQVNFRHTKAPPEHPELVKNKEVRKCTDLSKWRESKGRAVIGLPENGWEWRREPHILPGLYKLLMKAEVCTTYVRSMTISAGQEIEADVSESNPEAAIFALIIACDIYKNCSIPNLSNAIADAVNLEKVLSSQGWDVKLCKNLSVVEAENALSNFSKRVSANNGPCIFAFCGHGVQCQGKEFLLLSDSLDYPFSHDLFENALRRQSIACDDVFLHLKRARRPWKFPTLIILDCCRDESFYRFSHSPYSRSIPLESESSLNFVAGKCEQCPISAIPNSLVVFSTCSGSTACDGFPGCGGPFMNSLCNQILISPNEDIRMILMKVRDEIELCSTTQLAVCEDLLKMRFSVSRCSSENMVAGVFAPGQHSEAILQDTSSNNSQLVCRPVVTTEVDADVLQMFDAFGLRDKAILICLQLGLKHKEQLGGFANQGLNLFGLTSDDKENFEIMLRDWQRNLDERIYMHWCAVHKARMLEELESLGKRNMHSGRPQVKIKISRFMIVLTIIEIFVPIIFVISAIFMNCDVSTDCWAMVMPAVGPSDMIELCAFSQSEKHVDSSFLDCPSLWLCFVLSVAIIFPLFSITLFYFLYNFLKLDSITRLNFYKPHVHLRRDVLCSHGNVRSCTTSGLVTEFRPNGTVEIEFIADNNVKAAIFSKDQFQWNFKEHPEVHASVCTW